MIWTYRLLSLLNAPVLAVSLLLAISGLLEFNYSYFTWQKAVMIIWPVPQAIGFWLAIRARRAENIRRAGSILLVQLIVFGGLTVLWFAVMLAAFPS